MVAAKGDAKGNVLAHVLARAQAVVQEAARAISKKCKSLMRHFLIMTHYGA